MKYENINISNVSNVKCQKYEYKYDENLRI